MKSIVYPAVKSQIEYLDAVYVGDTGGKLCAVDLGHHPAVAIKRMKNGRPALNRTQQFQRQADIALRDLTERALRNHYESVKCGVTVWNDCWYGICDFVVWPGGMGAAWPVIVQFHTAEDRAFDHWWHSLPVAADVCHGWLLGELYKARLGVEPAVHLFYRSPSRWAEFSFYPLEQGRYVATGQIDGTDAQRQMLIDPALLRWEMEDYLRQYQAFGRVPDMDYEDVGFTP